MIELLPARVLLEHAAAVVPHTDADGLAAGAIALRARREAADAALLLPRGRTPWSEPLPGGTLAVLDWGVRALDRPALFVDHHAPEPARLRRDQLVVSGHGETPRTSTAALVRRIVPEAPAWLAAVGAVGDLGAAGFLLPECEGVARTLVRRLVPLVNAPRRLPDGPVLEALAVLVDAEGPAAALADPRTALLEEAKREWLDAYHAALRVPPAVHDGVAVIRLSSPYQVHPVVATTWARRLGPRVVLAANDGYLPGRVNFAVRGGEGDLRAALRRALPDGEGEFAHGHDRATGGSLDPRDFERLLAGLAVA